MSVVVVVGVYARLNRRRPKDCTGKRRRGQTGSEKEKISDMRMVRFEDLKNK